MQLISKSLQTEATLAVSIREAATRLGLSRTRLYQELAAGRIKAVKSGRRTLVLVESLKAYLARLSAYQTRGGTNA